MAAPFCRFYRGNGIGGVWCMVSVSFSGIFPSVSPLEKAGGIADRGRYKGRFCQSSVSFRGGFQRSVSHAKGVGEMAYPFPGSGGTKRNTLTAPNPGAPLLSVPAGAWRQGWTGLSAVRPLWLSVPDTRRTLCKQSRVPNGGFAPFGNPHKKRQYATPHTGRIPPFLVLKHGSPLYCGIFVIHT